MLRNAELNHEALYSEADHASVTMPALKTIANA